MVLCRVHGTGRPGDNRECGGGAPAPESESGAGENASGAEAAQERMLPGQKPETRFRAAQFRPVQRN